MGRRSKTGAPKIVVLTCDNCGRFVGNGGYLAVDRIAAMERRAQVGQAAESDSGGSGVVTLDRLIFWRLVHPECDPKPRATDYRIASRRFTTTGDLLEATAFLMRTEPWVIETNWSGLIGRVLADTRRSAQPQKAEAEGIDDV
jgi:hypothetical protein